MKRQKPTLRGRDEQKPDGSVVKLNQPLDPEPVKKGLVHKFPYHRPAMKTARPRPLSDESDDEADDVQNENMSLESEYSSASEDSDSNDSPPVAKNTADPYSPPDSDEDALLALSEAESSDDEIQVKMPAKQPAMPVGLKSKGSPSSSNAKVKVEYIEQFPPEGAEMEADEKKKALKDIGKDTFEKKVEEPMEVEKKPDHGLKEKDDEPSKDKKEQKPKKATEKPKEADEKVKEQDGKEKQDKEPKAENSDKKREDEQKVAGQDKKEKKDVKNPKKHGLKHRSSQKCKPKKAKRDEERPKEKKKGLKSGHKRSQKPKSQEAPEGSGDKAGTEPPSAKRPKEGD